MTGGQVGMPWHSEGPRRQNWATPMPLFREIERRFARGGFNLDPCAEEWSAKCAKYFTASDNGLAQPWLGPDQGPGRVFCNPPYDAIEAWADKAHAEVSKGNAEVAVLLVPARTGQVWFQFIALPFGTVHFIVGRVNFVPPPGATHEAKSGGAFEDSIVVVFERPLNAADHRGGAR